MAEKITIQSIAPSGLRTTNPGIFIYLHLILGKDPEKDTVTRICPWTGKPKWFLYEIVSNKRTGIDCDKFDYFARDCANVGVTSNFDYRRYFENVRILPIDDRLQICVREKEVFNLYELFHTRWSLHHRVYQHKTQAPIHDLLLKAFLKVDKILRISESVTDMKRYTVLTDSIMYDILRNESGDPRMLKAQELLLKIQRRELYKFCGQTQPGSETDFPSESEIVDELASISEGDLEAEKIFVSIVNIHFGMEHKDPVDAVVFYNKSYQPLEVRKDQVSQILPQRFHERYVRVYAKSREDSVTIQRCFEAWCSNKGYPVPHMLHGDCTGYFSPAFKLNQGSKNGAVTATPRSLKGEFEKIQNS
jgi:HD superfamily phosphohydrolase